MHYKVTCPYCNTTDRLHESAVHLKYDIDFGEYITTECTSCAKFFSETLYEID